MRIYLEKGSLSGGVEDVRQRGGSTRTDGFESGGKRSGGE